MDLGRRVRVAIVCAASEGLGEAIACAFPREEVQVVVFLSSDRAGYIGGTTVRVDAGMAKGLF
jgi:NAD(P)-dependent dehydrogenase (short-subunit alcohol dehydrogenase family)